MSDEDDGKPPDDDVEKPSSGDAGGKPPDDTVTHIRAASPDGPDPARFTPGSILNGRYRIVAPLGSGGAGEVYRAEDMKLGQTVALKFISRRIASDRSLLKRIWAEVRVGREVSHPNVCRIYDIEEINGQYFITMEYVDGENLASLLRRVGHYPEARAVEVAREMCAGLAAIHDRDIVHRDMKPSNIMIDGRGHVRITDFGLAVASGQISAESFAGTPAYMAPEQLEGAEATDRSDIYSLGLVLYEMFTGQRFFNGSFHEIVSSHQKEKRPPSTITRGLTPLIERLILHAIEESPANRPETVGEVLAVLPGAADPLRAAIAAGETPSPRAVAAAEVVGELSVGAAWLSVAAILLLLAGIAAVSRYTMLYKRAPLAMSPDVLTQRAREIIRTAGYSVRPQGSRRWMGKDAGVLSTAAIITPADRPDVLERFSPLRFGYRESPLPLIPQGRGGTITQNDPPFNVPEMVTVLLDSQGQLVRFIRAPDPQSAVEARPVSWQKFFEFARLVPETFVPSADRWVAPVDHDSKQSWTSVLDGRPRLQIDVHAAALGGKPVFFEAVLHPEKLTGQAPAGGGGKTTTEQFTSVVGFAIVFTCGLVLALVVARRNIRLGRGDRTAARKVSLLVFVSTFMAGLLSADHTSDAGGEWGLLIGIAGNSLYNAGSFWLFYIAAEPYVRRRQPELLISWNRVVSGFFRDALVGRHVLYGCLLGALMNLFYTHFLVLVPPWLGMAVPLPDHSFPEKLAGGVWPLVSLTALLGSVPLQSVLALFIFSAVRSVFRSDWIAAAVLVLVSAIPFLGRDLGLRVELPFVLCATTLFVFALCRIGLLSGMVALFISQWLNTSIFIFDSRSWLFVPSLIYISVTLAIVLYGFRYSLGAKPLLGRLRLAE